MRTASKSEYDPNMGILLRQYVFAGDLNLESIMVYKRATPPLGVCLGSFGVPLGSFWVALGLLWGALELLWGALELLWGALGPPWAPKLWGPSWGGANVNLVCIFTARSAFSEFTSRCYGCYGCYGCERSGVMKCC